MPTAISSQRKTALSPETLYPFIERMMRNNIESIESRRANFKTGNLTAMVNRLTGRSL